MTQEHARCLNAMKAQENELSSLQDQLCQSRSELRAANVKMKDLSQTLDEKNFQLKKMVVEILGGTYTFLHFFFTICRILKN